MVDMMVPPRVKYDTGQTENGLFHERRHHANRVNSSSSGDLAMAMVAVAIAAVLVVLMLVVVVVDDGPDKRLGIQNIWACIHMHIFYDYLAINLSK
jgi:hypothetical protein